MTPFIEIAVYGLIYSYTFAFIRGKGLRGEEEKIPYKKGEYTRKKFVFQLTLKKQIYVLLGLKGTSQKHRTTKLDRMLKVARSCDAHLKCLSIDHGKYTRQKFLLLSINPLKINL